MNFSTSESLQMANGWPQSVLYLEVPLHHQNRDIFLTKDGVANGVASLEGVLSSTAIIF